MDELERNSDRAIAEPTKSLAGLKDILPDFAPYNAAHIRWALDDLKLQEEQSNASTSDDSTLADVPGSLEAFEHLCDRQAWLQASELLLKPLKNGQPFHEWLQTSGYASEVIPLYKTLLHHVNPGMDGICWRGLGQAHYHRQDYGAAAQAWQNYLDHRQRKDDRPILETVYLPLGFAQYQTGDLAAAIATWRRCLPHLPNAEIQGLPVSFYCGLAHYKQNEFEAAIAQLEAALPHLKTVDLQPQYCQALETLGYAYIHQEQTIKAIAAWEELCQYHANSAPELLKNLGFAHAALQQHTSTIAYLTRYVASENPTPAAWTALGMAHYEQQQFEAAIAPLETGLAQGQPPETAKSMRDQVYRMLGDAHYQQANYPAAQQYLEQYCALNTTTLKPQDYLNLLAQLGHCAYTNQAWPQVIQYGETYHQHSQQTLPTPATIQVDSHLGQAYFAMGQYGRAIAPLERDHQHRQDQPSEHPDERLALQYLGQAYFETGQYADAIAPLEQFLEHFLGQDSRSAGEQYQEDLDAIAAVEFALGKAAYKTQDYGRAHRYLSRYLDEQEPAEHLDILFYCGSAAVQIPDATAAIARFEQYLELAEAQSADAQPSSRQYRTSLRHLGILHAQEGQHAIALETLQRYLTHAQNTDDVATPQWVQAVQTAGQLCQYSGDYPQAIAYFTDLCKVAQSRGDLDMEHLAQLHLSDIHLILGHYSKAQAQLTQILQQVEEQQVTEQGEGTNKAPIRAKTMARLGAAYHAQGQAERSLFYCQKALRLVRALEDHAEEGKIFDTLGRIYTQMGDRDRALSLHQQAEHIARRGGNPREIAIALGNLGKTYGEGNDHAQGATALQESLTLAEKVGDRYQVAKTLCYLSQSHRQLGRYDATQNALDVALKESQTLKVRPLEAETLYQIAQLKRTIADRANARRYSQNAIAIAAAHELPTLERYKQLYAELTPSLGQRLRAWIREQLQRIRSNPSRPSNSSRSIQGRQKTH